MNIKILIYHLLAVFLMNDIILPKIIYVPQDKSTIQSAIEFAQDTDTILVSPGTYNENINFSGKKIIVGSLFLTTGDTTRISQTIISGGFIASTVSFWNTEDSTSVLCGFTITKGVAGIGCHNSNPTLRNLIISNNKSGNGAGVYCDNSSPSITDVVISNNEATGNYGGGLYCYKSSPRLKNVLITKNKVDNSVGVASGGGGIACELYSNPFLSNVTISRNSAKVAGGGIYIDDRSNITFDTTYRCNIYLNEAQVGYDIYSYDIMINVVVDTFTVMNPLTEHAFPIANFTFNILHAKISQNPSRLYVSPQGNNENNGLSWEEPLKTIAYAKSIINTSLPEPAIIYLAPGIYSSKTNGERYEIPWRSNLHLIGSGVDKTILMGDHSTGILFMDNDSSVTIKDLTITKGNFGTGGGIYCNNSSPNIINVIISDCKSLFGGGIYCAFNSVPTLINVLLYNNVADYWGGALYGYSAGYNLLNVTIVNNKALKYGGGIYCQSSHINGTNCIMWNNTPRQVYFYEESYSSISLSYSDIQDGREGIQDNRSGSIFLQQGTILNREPLFVDVKNNNYHLSDTSPCIGAGIVDTNSVQYDIENNGRTILPDTLIDIGAYENQLRVPVNGLLLADFTADKKNGYPPLNVAFTNYSRSSETITIYEWDFNNDGIIDSHEKAPVWTFTKPGLYTVRLKIYNGMTSDSLVLEDLISIYRKGLHWISPEGTATGDGTFNNPYTSIQKGIKAVNNKDTILVKPGIYNENIDYTGKNITVGSEYLLTHDTSFISSTRIRGIAGDNVVKFVNYENNSAVLIGMTIENGSGVQEGGGIFCRNSSPVLKNLIIQKNSSLDFGGGISCRSNSSPIISDVIIANNGARIGGGLCFLGIGGKPRIERTLIYKNTATSGVGSAAIIVGCDAKIINCTIAENMASVAGLCLEISSTLIINSILWNNGQHEILYRGTEADIVNSDLKGGKGGITVEFGSVNNVSFKNVMNLNPQFENTGMNNFQLSEASPCINSGTDFFVWKDEVAINYSKQFYYGINPDMGVYEYKTITSMDDELPVPKDYYLYQNFPNPFNPTTKIRFDIPLEGQVTIKIFDVLGREVTTLLNEEKNPGNYEVKFDGKDLSSGIYFYVLKAEEYKITKKMCLIK